MSYLVLARKWRPQTFRDLIGQEHVSQTLKNAIDSGRVAHAFLFTGARGVGKTSSARILAKALNCEAGPSPEPCNTCSACVEITDGNAVDVFEIDGASNTGVDDIRELRENVKYLPSRSRYKIFIIDEVHMLSTSAFNALLKTLEEPPPHVKFIFATTEPHKVPITILSRCQRFDFRRISLPMIVGQLRHILNQEGVEVSDAALAMIARKGDGSMRDSLSTLDQVLAFCGETITDEAVINLLGVIDRRMLLECSRGVFSRDCSLVVDIVRRVDASGYNMRFFCQELIDHFRTMTLLKAVGGSAELPDLADAELTEITQQLQAVELRELQRYLTILIKAETEMQLSGFPRLVLELALIKMATLLPVVPVDEILERLRALETRIAAGQISSPPVAWQSTSPAAPPDRSGRLPSSAPEGVKKPDQAKERAPAAVQPEKKGQPSWEGLVAFIRNRKRLLASLLDHGHPLECGEGGVLIGFAAGSFQFKQMQDQDVQADLKLLTEAYFETPVSVKVVPVDRAAGNPPPSLLEKKNSEIASRRQHLEEQGAGHPVVSLALEIFGGEIAGVAEGERNNS